ncbi:hypothetical protein ACZ90_26835 [Streptomyces albus subsp. albus]|nr:hypothetical protein ACZ90_26835 [Streptomyces albus subsp. albus]
MKHTNDKPGPGDPDRQRDHDTEADGAGRAGAEDTPIAGSEGTPSVGAGAGSDGGDVAGLGEGAGSGDGSGAELSDPEAGRGGSAEPSDLEVGKGGSAELGEGAGSGDGDGTGTGDGGAGSGGPGLDGAEAGGFDERLLRGLLQGAVEDLEPAPDALEHLRRAVPARRTRRRQALVGAVAALVLGGAALPALVHVATTGNGSHDRRANAGSSESTPGVQGGAHGEGSDGRETGRPTGPGDEGKHHKGKDGKKDGKKEGPKHGGTDPGPIPSSTLNATSPTCTRAQLSNSAASTGPADANGNVYGSFRMVNISSSPCTVDGPGSVSSAPQGGADPARITVVDHTSGDAATDLPDPATVPATLILQPGEAFQVRFAWIPAAGGGPSGCTATSTPTPDPSPDAGGAAPDGQTDSEQPDTGGTTGGDPGQPDASVLLTYTPASGAPDAGSTSVPNACAGTIYRTGVLAG